MPGANPKGSLAYIAIRRVAKAEEELLYETRFDRVLENDVLEHTLAEAERIVSQFVCQEQ